VSDQATDVIQLDDYRTHRVGYATCGACDHKVMTVALEQDPMPPLECHVCGEFAKVFDDA
jgi:hypothetical protein